jgi:hypothetical protein
MGLPLPSGDLLKADSEEVAAGRPSELDDERGPRFPFCWGGGAYAWNAVETGRHTILLVAALPGFFDAASRRGHPKEWCPGSRHPKQCVGWRQPATRWEAATAVFFYVWPQRSKMHLLLVDGGAPLRVI